MAKKRLFLFFSLILLSLPILSCKPACPIVACQVRMVHRHGGEQDYRGQPIYKKQNPKMGEKLPKQKSESSNRNNDKSRNRD